MWIKGLTGTVLLINFRKGKISFAFPLPVFILQSLFESIDDLSLFADGLLSIYSNKKIKLSPITAEMLSAIDQLNSIENQDLINIEAKDFHIRIHTY